MSGIPSYCARLDHFSKAPQPRGFLNLEVMQIGRRGFCGSYISNVRGQWNCFGLDWSNQDNTYRPSHRSEKRRFVACRYEYIKRGVDDVRLVQREQGRSFEALAERVTRVEESAKQAHHRPDRIDRLEGQ
jgi:hypothetical protein